MDPDATLERIAMALLDGDKAEARAGKKDLLTWLRSGGFEPRWASHPHAYAFVAGKKIPKAMDPDTVLQDITYAIARGDAASARKSKRALSAWLRRGGLEPDWKRQPPQVRDYVLGKKIQKPKGPKFSLTRVHLNQGGYANRGRDYFGQGAPLFRYDADDIDEAEAVYDRRVGHERGGVEYTGRNHSGYLRASDREAAKARVRKSYPGARF